MRTYGHGVVPVEEGADGPADEAHVLQVQEPAGQHVEEAGRLAPIEHGAAEGVADDRYRVRDVDGNLGQVVLRARRQLNVEAARLDGLHQALAVHGGARLLADDGLLEARQRRFELRRLRRALRKVLHELLQLGVALRLRHGRHVRQRRGGQQLRGGRQRRAGVKGERRVLRGLVSRRGVRLRRRGGLSGIGDRVDRRAGADVGGVNLLHGRGQDHRVLLLVGRRERADAIGGALLSGAGWV